MPKIPSLFLWIASPSTAQFLLPTNLITGTEKRYPNVNNRIMALSLFQCGNARANFSRIWSFETTIFRARLNTRNDSLCGNLFDQGISKFPYVPQSLDYWLKNQKLLVSLPKHMRSDLEAASTKAIHDASETFQKQCVSPSTGCAMQARFLKNVLRKYKDLKIPRRTLPSLSKQDHQHQLPPIQSTLSQHHTNQNSSNREIGANTLSPPLYLPTNSHSPDSQPDFQANLFENKDMWENLFSDVGFWTGEGIFLSDNFTSSWTHFQDTEIVEAGKTPISKSGVDTHATPCHPLNECGEDPRDYLRTPRINRCSTR